MARRVQNQTKTVTSKSVLRRKYLELRNRLPLSYRRRASRKITRHFFDWLDSLEGIKLIAVYISARSEVNTRSIIARLARRKIKSAAPRVLPNGKIEFRLLSRGLRNCRPGAYGILEPSRSASVVPAGKVDVVLVPGVAFDPRGYRLGYGKGYYDRWLASRRKILSAGLCYNKTLAGRLPNSKMDQPVKIVITESKAVQI